MGGDKMSQKKCHLLIGCHLTYSTNNIYFSCHFTTIVRIDEAFNYIMDCENMWKSANNLIRLQRTLFYSMENDYSL